MQHSRAEQQVIVAVAEKKLHLYQQQREKMEDMLEDKLKLSSSLSSTTLSSESSEGHALGPPVWELSADQMERVEAALGGGSCCLSDRFSINIFRDDLLTLVGSQWLNDSVSE